MRTMYSLLLVVALTVVFSNAVEAQVNSLRDVIDLMPANANAILVANVDSIRASELAKKENWFDGRYGDPESGVSFLPPGAKAVALTAEMDLQTLTSLWTTGAIRMDKPPTLSRIVDATGGTMDEVQNRDVVATSQDSYLFNLDPQTLGLLIPAKRQKLHSWLSDIDRGATTANLPYLKRGIDSSMTGTDLAVAVDLQNVLSSMAVLPRAQESKLLSRNKVDAKAFADTIGSIQGVTLNVDVTDSIQATLQIDFAMSADVLLPIARKLVLEVINDYGIGLEGLKQWEMRIDHHQLRFSGSMSKNDLRRVISLFESTQTHVTAEPGSQVTGQGPSAAAAATKYYFDSVSAMFSGLQRDIGPGAVNGFTLQRWLASYSQKIDNLPVRDVDPLALDFGDFVAGSLQNISSEIMLTRNSVDVEKSKIMTSGSGSPTNRRQGRYTWGYYNKRNSAMHKARAEIRDASVRGRASVADYAIEVMGEIEKKQRELRRTFEKSYPDAFVR